MSLSADSMRIGSMRQCRRIQAAADERSNMTASGRRIMLRLPS
ncbi:hypothetical protein [Pseudoxanthomonas putridarboris]|uniref:Uncharacterized protein n=1 Tax=Pseudoxanthomonas putridarboris TaxID=752605 RepID=A0ABU9J4H7_9GAMM